MKIFEYANERNIKSKDVVARLHELGYKNIKNHLSLIPDKALSQLDATPFTTEVKTVKTAKTTGKNIAIVSMECAPFVSKGLGNLVKNKIQQDTLAGNQVTVIIPKYNFTIETAELAFEFTVDIYHKAQTGKVYRCDYDKAVYYLIDSDYYFNRDKLYGFYDDAERYAFLAKGAIQVIQYLNTSFSVINVHDWPFGLFPILFKESLAAKYPDTKIEFSVYGSTYSGIYGVDVLTDVYGIDKKYYDNHTVEYASSVNFLKTGLVTADKVDINQVALNELKGSYLKEFV